MGESGASVGAGDVRRLGRRARIRPARGSRRVCEAPTVGTRARRRPRGGGPWARELLPRATTTRCCGGAAQGSHPGGGAPRGGRGRGRPLPPPLRARAPFRVPPLWHDGPIGTTSPPPGRRRGGRTDAEDSLRALSPPARRVRALVRPRGPGPMEPPGGILSDLAAEAGERRGGSPCTASLRRRDGLGGERRRAMFSRRRRRTPNRREGPLLQLAQGGGEAKGSERRPRISRRARADLWRSVVTGDGALAVAAEDELGMRATAAFKRVPMRLHEADASTRGGAAGRWGDAMGQVDAYAAPATTGDASRGSGGARGGRGEKTTVDGVDVDLETTLETLHGAMRGSDQFLHVRAWL